MRSKIKKLRKDNNLTQDEFANELNVSRQTVISWEKGLTTPQMPNIQSMVERFNLTTDYFFETTPQNIKEPTPIKEESFINLKTIIINHDSFIDDFNSINRNEFNFKYKTIPPFLALLSVLMFFIGFIFYYMFFVFVILLITTYIAHKKLKYTDYFKKFQFIKSKLKGTSFCVNSSYTYEINDRIIFMHGNKEVLNIPKESFFTYNIYIHVGDQKTRLYNGFIIPPSNSVFSIEFFTSEVHYPIAIFIDNTILYQDKSLNSDICAMNAILLNDFIKQLDAIKKA